MGLAHLDGLLQHGAEHAEVVEVRFAVGEGGVAHTPAEAVLMGSIPSSLPPSPPVAELVSAWPARR
jgi:hypothetical protein